MEKEKLEECAPNVAAELAEEELDAHSCSAEADASGVCQVCGE